MQIKSIFTSVLTLLVPTVAAKTKEDQEENITMTYLVFFIYFSPIVVLVVIPAILKLSTSHPFLHYLLSTLIYKMYEAVWFLKSKSVKTFISVQMCTSEWMFVIIYIPVRCVWERLRGQRWLILLPLPHYVCNGALIGMTPSSQKTSLLKRKIHTHSLRTACTEPMGTRPCKKKRSSTRLKS